MRKKILTLFFFILLISTNVYSSEKIKIFYSGFSFSNSYHSNKNLTKYTSKLIKKRAADKKIDIISESLLKIVREEKFSNINLDTKNLLDFEKYPDNAIVMAVALQHEEFSQEYNSSIKKYSGFYDAYFQIIFYDFSDRSLIAAIPFEFEIPILSSNKLDEKNILKRINNFYLKDRPFKQIVQIINRYNIKQKYDLRIGVTNVNIQERAFNDMPRNTKNNQDYMKNLIAQSFSKRLSENHNVAIVPFTEGQAIGRSMKLKFAQSDKIFDIKLPNPDYHIAIGIKGFKKVLAQSTAVEDLYLYGSFVNFKIYQPELNKYYFDQTLRGVTQVKIPKEQSDINDWRKYYYNLETLFDDFSKNIIKQDKKWLKKATKKKIKKEIKNLNFIINKLK